VEGERRGEWGEERARARWLAAAALLAFRRGVMEAAELLAEVDTALKEERTAEALEKCDRLLALSPNDADVLRVKLVCLIELGQYADALQLLEGGAAPQGSAFERAYCLYQLNRETEALAALQGGGRDGGGEAHTALLAAQVHYRLGQHAEAARLLGEAAAHTPPSAELNTNILAALISAGQPRTALEAGEAMPELSGFELFYNRACAAIELGELTEAKRLLELALSACRELLSTDDYTESEIEVELGILTAQAAYVDQQRGDNAAAAKAYEELHSFKADLDPAVAAVTSNNIVALRGGEHDLFDSWKKCRANLTDSLARKLTAKQRRAFLFNGALLSMHMNKTGQCKELLATLSSEFPAASDSALIHSAMAARSKARGAEAEQLLADAAVGADDPRPALTLAQLQLRAKQPEQAVRTLESITSLQSSLGMVGTRVALYERLGMIDAAAAALEGAADAAPVLHAAADFHTRHGRWREAATVHQRLLDLNPRDLQALAGLVIATSHFDAALANEHLARLETCAPPIDQSSLDELNAERLEQASLPRTARVRDENVGGRKRDTGAADASEAERPKKKRRSRKKPLYPKGFDPANPGPPPDPERWLPKRERSNYRARRKDKRGVSRGPQGSTAGQARPDARATTNVKSLTDEERLRAKAAEEAKARSEAAQAAAAASGGGGKKKGKKGKR